MEEQQQNIRDKKLYKCSSAKRYLKIHVPDFAFKHDDNNVGKDKFVGRELQIRKLFTWLTSDSKSGSYLITGYRGMGKSLLVKRVIDMISREPKAYKEVIFQFAMVLTLAACFVGVVIDHDQYPNKWMIIAILGSIALLCIAILEASKQINVILYEYNIHKVPLHHIFDKDMIAKVWLKNKDRRNRKYSNIAITVNLGQEVLNERDVLSLIAHNIREKYYRFVHDRQNRPITNFIYFIISGILSFCLTRYLFVPIVDESISIIVRIFSSSNSWISALVLSAVDFLGEIITQRESIQQTTTDGLQVFLILYALIYLLLYLWAIKILKKLRKKVPRFSVPYNALDKLDVLCERVASSLNEEKGTHPQYSSSFFNFSFGKAGKSKSTPIATVRELEQELMEIINDINGDDCPIGYQAQFVIVFDELDKIANVHKKGILEPTDDEDDPIPAYDASVRGFTEIMPYEQRKQNVLRLLANMKLFITSVKAKCVFISGYELFDASLADLSDREFAISSIFNGVLNVTSFLSPEREESDVSSMTEVYLATMLLPESELKDKLQRNEKDVFRLLWVFLKKKMDTNLSKIISFWPVFWPESYLKKRVKDNIQKNGLLKDELPSLRWYYQYLMEIHILNNEKTLSKDEIREREQEIRHVMEFLRNFCVYLSHISNGSPKKIATYFEKYVRVNYDTIKQFDWYDVIEVGMPTEDEVRKQCVLYFDPDAQKLVNFIHYIAAPVMNAITNEVSHYGDKLLVSSSFILDQIYKYHGKGFSWRNLELMPELLNTNKNPELRDALASIMEFLLQTHITTISSSIFQYKFHKQISEEISMLSKTSEEAAAIFNFTLNESETVKRYNIRLLWNYMTLTSQTKDKDQKERYCSVLERLHENQGDIYFSEEDYYRAVHEYRSALQYIDEKDISAKNLIPYLKCSLKIGMSYEYRHTFENAYMVYCQIINKLIHLRWVEESEYGLDYTMRLTKDWRIKQTVLVDAGALRGWNGSYSNSELRRHFKPGLLEDLRKHSILSPEFSYDSDKTISTLSKNFTPEKSNILLQLTAFEDIKFIYQAIIAKLFVIEKMESSGITQSSIDAAEAEFITLYGAVNYNEKYILAADFFSKLGSILYYKNAVVTTEIKKNDNSIDTTEGQQGEESIYTTLYLYDIDILALIDDYCYLKSNSNNDAIIIKEEIQKDLFNKKTSIIVDGFKESSPPDKLKKIILNNEKNDHETLFNYLEYLDDKECFNIQNKWKKLIGCYRRRTSIREKGHKIPCTACKYINRSLDILMVHLFDYKDSDKSKTITLLRHSSHRSINNLRPEILSQLAFTTEQLADILMSCGYTKVKNVQSAVDELDLDSDTLSVRTIELLIALADQRVIKDKYREEAIEKLGEGHPKGNINKALLYYWAAFRYYDIASMHHEAVHCIWRITCVIENYLSTLFDIHSRNDIPLPILSDSKDGEKNVDIDKLTLLLQLLFTQATRIVSRQHDNYDSVEIHELKWLFHKELVDDLDLTGLTLFPNLQSIFISIVNIKLSILQLTTDYTVKRWGIKRFPRKSKEKGNEFEYYRNEDENNYSYYYYDNNNVDKRSDYITKMYKWVTRIRHERTFKSDIELNRIKVKLNYLILNEIITDYDVVKKHLYDESDIKDFYKNFLAQLNQSIKSDDYIKERLLFNNNTTSTCQDKLDAIDFLIYDSIVSLCSIINVLPPHNQYSTFSNSFVAGVYENLWVWSKYYEVMYNMYLYYKYYLTKNTVGMNKLMSKYFREDRDLDTYEGLMRELVDTMESKNVTCRDDYGDRYAKLFMNIRHNVDDSTIHHVFLNYSAEMAIKYYRAVRGSNSEGQEYKNMINNMYLLDDDLRNDTCQSNLADERYLINNDVINEKRLALQRLYDDSRSTRLSNYESPRDEKLDYIMLHQRFSDSPNTNTEY